MQDVPPGPFSFFFPSGFIWGSAFMNTTPTFCKRSGSFVFPSHSGLGGRTGPPLCENTPVHNRGDSPRRGKNLPRLLNCPTIAPSSLGKSMGLEFSCNLEYKTLLPLFSSVGTFVFPIPSGIGGRTGPPLCKNTPVHNRGDSTCRGKNLPRFPDCPAIAPGSLGKPLGFEFP